MATRKWTDEERELHRISMRKAWAVRKGEIPPPPKPEQGILSVLQQVRRRQYASKQEPMLSHFTYDIKNDLNSDDVPFKVFAEWIARNTPQGDGRTKALQHLLECKQYMTGAK